MWWGVQQVKFEPFASYTAKVLDLVEHVSGRAVAVWSKEDRETMFDLFEKGLWDFEAVYLVNYLSKETLLSDISREQLINHARHLDQNHGPNGRTAQGRFHPWRRWLECCRESYDSWWTSYAEGRARGYSHTATATMTKPVVHQLNRHGAPIQSPKRHPPNRQLNDWSG